MSQCIIAQQRTILQGVVTVNGQPYGNVNIVNISSDENGKNVIRSGDKDGHFKINCSEGDVLVFSSADLLRKTVIISKDHIAAGLKVEMSIDVMSLDDVVVTDSGKYSALSLGIIQKEIKTRTPAERRLYTAGDFKPIHLLGILGGTLAVDPILNAINGRTNSLKREVVIEKKESNLDYFREKYSDYLISVIKVPEEELARFIYYIIEAPEAQQLVDDENVEMTKFRLTELYSKFLAANKE